jgi:phosphatidate cytidylyltransferase
VLKNRIATSAIGIPPLVYVALADSLIPIKVLVALIGLFFVLEISRAEKQRLLFVSVIIYFLWVYVLFTSSNKNSLTPYLVMGCLCVAVILFLSHGLLNIEARAIGLQCFWVLIPFSSLVFLRKFHVSSGNELFQFTPTSLLLLVFLCVWFGDIAGYVVGKSLGKHPLAPKISPGKTVEGAVGYLVFSLLAGLCFSRLGGGELIHGFYVGLTVGVMGQAGDLFESLWKRKLGTKDSGSILPGHGGFLDRFDSMLFAAPSVYFLFSLL